MTPLPLHHRVDGPADAPPLLMGGSLGTNLGMWDGQLGLADAFRLVRFDHRGHGGSPVPDGPYTLDELGRDVLALMDTLELERASLCGLSIGGMVGMWLGVHAPDRVDRLVLICTAAYLPPAEAWQERAAAVRAAGTVETIADTVVERWLTPGFAAAHPDVRARLRAMLAATPAEGYAACCAAIETMDQRAQLSRITAPTLVISGGDDPATPPEMQREIATGVPGARLVTVEPAAHIAAVERPDTVTDLIREHLTSP